jgi:hypothetical protein
VIALPYGQSFTGALGQPAAAPYLDGQLIGQGTLLSGYTSLAGGQLAGAATLLSAQVTAGVTSISPPPCGSAGGAQAVPCPVGEPAGLQAADGFLRQVIGQITTTAAYREHGLIVITFGAGQEGTESATGSPGAPTSSTGSRPNPVPGSATAYPAGTVTTTLSVSGQPTGALLLSPFLAHPGKRIATTFNPLAPRKSLEGLLGAHPG